MYAIDIIVKATSRESLDATMLSFGGMTGDRPVSDGWPVRVIGSDEAEARSKAGFIDFAITKQGYGEVVRWQDPEGNELARPA